MCGAKSIMYIAQSIAYRCIVFNEWGVLNGACCLEYDNMFVYYPVNGV